MKIIRSDDKSYIPASHEDPQNPGVLKKVLLSKSDFLPQGQPQMINWALLPAGHSFQPHYHQDMQEIFIILTGSVTITISPHHSPKNNDTYTLNAGDGIIIDHHEVHTMHNSTKADIEYLVLGVSLGQNGQTINI